MLPILLYNNMEGASNSLNNNANSSFTNLYDDSVILNCVRNRKKVSELPNCPICSCTIRQGELDSHLTLEVEKLHKISSASTKRKISTNNSSVNLAGPSTSADQSEDPEIDLTGCPGSDVYQRIHANRLRRLRARRRSPPLPMGECPVCNTTVPYARLQRHALRCLRRTGAGGDDLPDTSEEEGSIDVENDADEPSGGAFGAEYQWCGQWRVRASALQPPQARAATCVRRASNDQALVVDGDEDTELYGPPQYSPSRIAPDAEITPPADTHMEDHTDEHPDTHTEDAEDTSYIEPHHKQNGLVEASAETRIHALKLKIKDLEMRRNGASEVKCLICLGPYTSPAVSIQCWHVYCEVCWLQSLKAKKICPQCNAITTAQHLRRIYM